MAQSIDQLLDRAAELLAADRKVALCLLVKATGSTPVPAGAVVLVDDAAVTHGTIGGGCVEAELRRQVVAMISSGRTGVLHFELDHDHGWDDGGAKVAGDVLGHEQRALLVAAGASCVRPPEAGRNGSPLVTLKKSQI